MKNKRGITLISLIITIVVLVILSAVAIYLTLGNNGILNKAKEAKNETIKQTATEKMNLKITNMQIEKYAKEQRMPTLQEFADGLCEDDEIQYVQLQSKKVGSLSKIEIGEASSIFTKLKEYPYEFEINSSLQLASIDGIQVATNNDNQIPSGVNYSLEETKTNDTWMGKPIYTKTIYISSLPNATTKTYEHGIDNIDTIWIDQSGSFFMTDKEVSVVMPSAHTSSVSGTVSINTSKTEIAINTGTMNRSTWKAYVTLKYTKNNS